MGIFDKFFSPPGKDRFARMVLDAVHQAGERAAVRYEPEHFRLCREGEGKAVMNLANAYAEYCAAPREGRRVIFRNAVRAWFSGRKGVPQEYEDARHDLLPDVRSRAYYELAALRASREEEGAAFDWPFRVLAGSLSVGLVYDLPEAMVQVQRHHLDAWQVGFDEAFGAALENLRRVSGQRLEPAGEGVWASPWRDNYDPSRVFLIDLVRGADVAGDPVVMVPNRDNLLLAGAEDEDGLGRLAAMAEEAYGHPRSVSGMATAWTRTTPGCPSCRTRTIRTASGSSC
jgi:hypothetical protein